jgi:hypothetical protein
MAVVAGLQEKVKNRARHEDECERKWRQKKLEALEALHCGTCEGGFRSSRKRRNARRVIQTSRDYAG